MPSCAVPTCKNAADLKKKKHGITLHAFPADEVRRAQWTKIIRRARLDEYWRPSKKSVICSEHFDKKYFYESKFGLTRLTKEAFPNKNIATIVEEESSESCEEYSKNMEQPHSPDKSNSEIGDVNISDLEYVFDTPKEAKLRSQLRRSKILCAKHVRRIKTMHQRIKRLTKRNEQLKSLLNNLKKNRNIDE